ncbi:MAG: hypothetical protein KAU17_01895 [Spirochaetales bacterium]|nr:hypothetical protein [Spirochaetales bacterium]
MTDRVQPAIPEEDTISLLDLIAVLAKRWKFIAVTTFTAAILIVLFSIFTLKAPSDSPWNPMPNLFTPQVKARLQEGDSGASSMFKNASSELGILANLAGVSGGSSNADLAQALLAGNTLVDTITGEFDFLTRYNIGEEHPVTSSRELFRGKLQVDFDDSTAILTIGYEDIDRNFATKVVNRTLEVLDERFSELTMDQIKTKKTFIEERLDEVTDELEKIQNQVINFQKTYGIVDIEAQALLQIEEIAKLNTDIINKEVELRGLLEHRTSQDPQVQRLQKEIVQARELLDSKKMGFSDFSTDYLPQNQLPEISARYAGLRTELEIQQNIYGLLRSQYETVKLEELDNSKMFQIIELAEIPEIKSGPSRGKLCIIVTITAFFLAVFGAFIMEYFEKIKNDPIEAEKLALIKGQFFRPARKK